MLRWGLTQRNSPGKEQNIKQPRLDENAIEFQLGNEKQSLNLRLGTLAKIQGIPRNWRKSLGITVIAMNLIANSTKED